jgi:flagellar motility protein MotE (MotC chaperone)
MARARKPRIRGRRVILPLIAATFLGSGLLRLQHQTGMVWAESEPQPADQFAGDPDAPDTAALLAALQDRAAQLDAREAALADRESALSLIEAEVREQLAALEAAESSLAQTLALAATAAEDDLERLSSVYEAMKPQDAADLFATMDPAFAAGFLGRMQTEAAAAIMTRLDPDIAYAISAMLAGRNADVPREDGFQPGTQ